MPSVVGTSGSATSGANAADGDQGQAGDYADSTKLDSKVQLNLENLTKIDEKF